MKRERWWWWRGRKRSLKKNGVKLAERDKLEGCVWRSKTMIKNVRGSLRCQWDQTTVSSRCPARLVVFVEFIPASFRLGACGSGCRGLVHVVDGRTCSKTASEQAGTPNNSPWASSRRVRVRVSRRPRPSRLGGTSSQPAHAFYCSVAYLSLSLCVCMCRERISLILQSVLHAASENPRENRRSDS